VSWLGGRTGKRHIAAIKSLHLSGEGNDLKKIILWFFVILSLLMAACGGNSTSQPSAPDAQPQPQPDVPRQRSLVFSALLDEALGFDIYRINTDGSGLAPLANNPARDMYPAWSPDGSKIAFCSDRQGKNQLYVMNADGSDQQRLREEIDDCGTPSWAVPAWSPDGKWISILTYPGSDFPQGKAHIYLVDPGTAQSIDLTDTPASQAMLSWSPDSQFILFESERDGNVELYTISLDGQQLTRLTDHPARDGGASWSPDGRQIVFISDRDGNVEIYSLNLADRQVTRLTDSPAMELSPSWSPNGEAIAFTSNKDGNTEIYRMNADGSAQTNLTNSPGEDYWFTWSPDGQWIVSSTCVADCQSQQSRWNSAVMKSNGSSPLVLFEAAASFAWQP
jgi:Tol biopolymer transport system component